ncbi:MAG: lipid II:glycine glycyltransferase FemX [Candidatus Methylomirabilales bacterium]
MEIQLVDPRTDRAWHRLIARHPSTVFHSPEWMGVLADTYAFDVRALVALDEAGEPRSGVPFCPIQDFRGARLVALPFCDYCDPLVEDRGEWEALLGQMLSAGQPLFMRCLRNPLPVQDARLTTIRQARWHGVDLQDDVDAVWNRCEPSARRAIRKAQHAGVQVRPAEDEKTLRAFYDLHLGVRKFKYRLLAQPYTMFESVWQRFLVPQKGRLLVATKADEIIAGAVFLKWKDRLFYKFAASDPAHLGDRPNDLVMWEGIRYAKAEGLTYLDLGLSDWEQEGLIRYKRKFATEEGAIRFLRLSHTAAGPGGDHAFLHELTQLFTDPAVPDRVTEMAGGVLYRYLA